MANIRIANGSNGSKYVSTSISLSVTATSFQAWEPTVIAAVTGTVDPNFVGKTIPTNGIIFGKITAMTLASGSGAAHCG